MSGQPTSSFPGTPIGQLLIDDANAYKLNASLLYINSLPVEHRYDRYLQVLNHLLSISRRNNSEVARSHNRAQGLESRRPPASRSLSCMGRVKHS
ncbi:uncharacterized protein ACHE_20849S [Aspergillus chevalieri]|uniref:Uncharacterized protein n=1 Tax=Aspergillus chevalieri TaxID=182096 RepID=A0A7R7VIM6_ASPCH|nr:uncharacterized protein ACHE_20849S [Aspergillus chevalieri]BCR85391.1 hypothetical protein ACHE_20849S [Aspergillus chevalieri]